MAVWLIVVALLVVLVGAFPTWRHSRGWGYAPSGWVGILLGIFLILIMLGYI